MMNRSQNPKCVTVLEMLLQFSLFITPDRGQSKTLLIIDDLELKIARNRVFYCHLSPVNRKLCFNIFYLLLLIVLTFSIAAYPLCF